MLSLMAVVLLNKTCPGLMHVVVRVVKLPTSAIGYRPDTNSCVGYST